jgi:hypothetical protein
MKKYCLAVFFTWFCTSLFSQQVETHSNVAYIYAIRQDHFKLYNEKYLRKNISAICSTTPVDTIAYKDIYYLPTSFKKPGAYLVVYIEENITKFNVIANFPWKTQAVFYPIDGGILVTDSLNQSTRGLKISFESEKLKYDKNAGVYTYWQIDQNGTLSVSNGKMDQQLKLNTYASSYNNRNYNDNYTDLTGFIATNKPVYKHGDTLKVKVYLCNQKGKPYTNDIQLRIRQSYNLLHTTGLSPVSPGAYVYEYLITDSLKLDNTYSIEVRDPKQDNSLLSNTFRLEDYKLDEIEYSFRPLHSSYYQDDSLYFQYEAYDKNHNTVFDAEIDIVAIPYYIGRIYSSSVYFPDTIYQGSFKMQDLNNGILQLPSSLKTKYPADYSLRILATCRNSNNELKKIETNIQVNQKKESYQTYISNYHIQFLEHQDLPDSIRIVKYFDFNTQPIEWKVSKKDSVKVDPLASSYIIDWGGEMKGITVDPYMFNVGLSGEMHADTLHLSFYNPAHIPVRIYSLKEEKKQYLQDTLHQFLVLRKNEQASIYYEYTAGGKRIVSSRSYVIDDKNVFLKTDLPDKVYPGQSFTMNISSSDYKNNPLVNTNLTVLSINAAFVQNNVPEIPVFGKQATTMSTSPKGYLSEIPCATYQQPVDSTWIARFGLQKNIYYQSVISKQKMIVYREPYVSGKGSILRIIELNKYGSFSTPPYIEENNEVVYYNMAETNHIKTTQGIHQYRIRELDYFYDLPPVTAYDDSITYVIIKPEFLSKKTDRKTINFVPELEQEKLKDRFMIVSNSGSTYPTFISNYHEAYCIPSLSTGYNFLGPFTGNDSAYVEQFYRNEANFITRSFRKGEVNYLYKNKNSIYDTSHIFRIQRREIARPFDLKNSLDYYYQDYTGWQASHFDKLYDKFTSYNYSSYNNYITTYNKVELLFADPHFTATGTILTNLTTGKTDKYRGTIKQFYALDHGSYLIMYVDAGLNLLLQDSFYVRPRGILMKIVDTTNVRTFATKDSSEGFGSLYRGIIMNEEMQEPIPFCNIVIEENGKLVSGTSADIDGKFQVRVPEGENIRVKFMSIGYPVLVYTGKDLMAKGPYLEIHLKGSTLELREYVLNSVTIQSVDTYKSMNYTTAIGITNVMGGVYTRDGSFGDATGSRNDAIVFIDGVKVRDGITGTLELTPGVQSSDNSFNFDKTDKLSGDDPEIILNANAIRTFFADNAIWHPNLISQQDGKVSCQVKFPENITSWDTYILAMHPKGYSGRLTAHSKSFKPVVASLYLPDFVIEGDSFEIVNKVMNYTPVSIETKNKLVIGTVDLMEVDTTLKDFYIHKKMLLASSDDSMRISFSTGLSNGYTDGEKRVIPIYRKGIMVSEGKMFPAWKNTTLYIDSLDKTREVEIEVFNGFDNFITKEADYLLFHYKHACNEQISSKLITAICASSFTSKGWKKELYDLQIGNMIRLLQKNQNDEGGWSWWNKGETNVFMTLKVGEALKLAEENGYEVKLKKTISGIFPYLLQEAKHRDDTLGVIKLAGLYQVPKESVFDLKSIYTLTLPTNDYQKLLVMEIKQLYQQKFNISELMSLKKETLYGNYYWGSNSYYLYDNATYMTAMALSIMEREKTGQDTLIKVLGYLMEKRVNGHFANTMVSAKMAVFFNRYLGTISNVDPSIVINKKDTIVVKNNYHRVKLNGDVQSIDVQTDKLIYIGYTQEKSLPFEAIKEDLFSIHNEWVQDGKVVSEIRSGKFVTLHTKVIVKKDAQYMSLEIPIPAGCTYAEKPNNQYYRSYEVHREYFKDRIVVYYERLPAGTYDLEFKLESRFNGNYTVNNTLMENMYFPQLNGYNALQTIKVR